MPVSSLIIRTDKNKTEAVQKALEAYSAISSSEHHGENLVITTDTRDRQEDKALWGQLEQIPGVVQCDLIYHNFEDVEDFSHE